MIFDALGRPLRGPQFHVVTRACLQHPPVPIETRARRERSPRPESLLRLVAAAQQARRQQVLAAAAIAIGIPFRGHGVG